MMNDVLVAFNAITGTFGTVYHQPSCGVLSRTYGTTEMTIEKAEDRGKGPCAFCHRTSTKRWLCPNCPGAMGPMHLALRMVKGLRGIHTCLECPDCRFKVAQADKDVAAKH